jgi:hypothetical protein
MEANAATARMQSPTRAPRCYALCVLSLSAADAATSQIFQLQSFVRHTRRLPAAATTVAAAMMMMAHAWFVGKVIVFDRPCSMINALLMTLPCKFLFLASFSLQPFSIHFVARLGAPQWPHVPG